MEGVSGKWREQRGNGKILPFLKKEGLKAFKLIIFKLDTNKFSIQDALIL